MYVVKFKLWHKCFTIDLRVGDINEISKQSKSWLYADLLEKPEELALYRETGCGGLGLLHVKLRALSCQINSFLETACSTKYTRNLYHEALFQYHVLGNEAQKPDIPPFFKGEFFPAIKQIYNSPLNIAKITIRQIYRFLLEGVTMVENNIPAKLKPLKVETANPSVQWEQIWQMARQKMLGPNLCTFLFKLLNQILPTNGRISRILPNHSPFCSTCRREEQVVETLEHAFFECRSNQGTGNFLL